MDKKLKIHIPSWSQEEFQVFVNGERLEALALEKGYVCIPQLPAEDFEVVLKLSMKLYLPYIGNGSPFPCHDNRYSPS